MRKRPLCQMAGLCFFAEVLNLAILKTERSVILIAAIMILILFLSLILQIVKKRAGKPVLPVWVPALFLCFFCLFFVKLSAICQWEKQKEEISGYEMTIRATVSWIENGNSVKYYLTDVRLSNGTQIGNVILQGEVNDVKIGNRILAEGFLSDFEKATNPGQFDMDWYYETQGQFYRMQPDQAVVIDDKTDWIMQKLYLLRCHLKNIVEKMDVFGDSSMICAIFLGEKGGVEEEVRQNYQKAGISHVLSISGLHLTMIGMAVYSFLRKRGISYPGSACVAGILFLGFLVMTGNRISCRRACIMLFLLLISKCLGRTFDMASAMAFAFMMILVEEPLAIYQSGFQFSFLAIFGISTLHPLLTEWALLKERHTKRGKRGIRIRLSQHIENGIAGGGSILAATIPVSAWNYFEIGYLGILCNLLVIPLMSLLFGGILVMVIAGELINFCENIGGIIFIESIFGKIGEISAYLVHQIFSLYERMGEISSQTGIALYRTGQPKIWQLFVYAFWLFFVILLTGLIRRHLPDRSVIRARILFLVSCALLLSGGMLLKRYDRVPFRMTVLDVGQGVGILCQADGKCYCFDGGSSSTIKVGKNRILPALKYYGITEVDAWFVSHPDEDHVNGLEEILKMSEEDSVKIGCIYLSEPDSAEKNSDFHEAYEKIKKAAKKRDVPCSEVYRMAQMKSGNLALTFLHPGKGEIGEDVNGFSQVIRMSYSGSGEEDGNAADTEYKSEDDSDGSCDLSILLTGDLTGKKEADLLDGIKEENEDLPWAWDEDSSSAAVSVKADNRSYNLASFLDCDVLLVPHHGSAYSSTAEFLEAVSPKIAIVSVGKNNYGQPSEKTEERLKKEAELLVETIERGAVTLEYRKKGITLRMYK